MGSPGSFKNDNIASHNQCERGIVDSKKKNILSISNNENCTEANGNMPDLISHWKNVTIHHTSLFMCNKQVYFFSCFL